MKRTYLIWGVLIVILIIALNWALQSPGNKYRSSGNRAKSGDSASSIMKITGLATRVVENGVLIARLRADEFKIKPRKFYVFRINPINEAELKNVTIDFYMPQRKYRLSGGEASIVSEEGRKIVLTGQSNPSEGETEGIDVFESLFKTVAGKGKGTGLITGVSIDGMRLNFYKGNALTHRLNASSANITLASRMLTFHNATLENPAYSRTISADRIIWDKTARVFLIPGHYSDITPNGTISGRGARIDLDFKITPL